MLKRWVWALCALLGCEHIEPGGTEALPPVSKWRGVLAGDALLRARVWGGDAGLGDTLEMAQAAFPAPEGAQAAVALSADATGKRAWGWRTQTRAVQVGFDESRVTFLLLHEKGQKVRERSLLSLDLPQPAREAEMPRAQAYLWEVGKNVRVYLALESGDKSGEWLLIGDGLEVEKMGFGWDVISHTVAELGKPGVEERR